jgi:hypothetical protein
MKKITTLVATVALAAAAHAQTARVQVIHNCADAAAASVDVWLNNTLLLDDFAFRTASPFVNAPAGTPFDLTICGPNSTDTTQEVVRFSGVTLTANETYVITANGIVSPTGYSPAQPFDLDIYPMGQETGTNSNNTDVLVLHGSTDAPTVDVTAVGVGTLVDDLAYGSYAANYLSVPTANYNIQIRNSAGTDVVAEFSAPLQTLNLGGAALTVVASGFLNPANNSNGPAFGLWVALPAGGNLVQLPSVPVSTTRAQIIHNCADAAAATVDVWLNNTLLIDNFAFRTATPFVDAPAGTPFDITICGPNSTDTTQEVIRFSGITLMNNTKYIITANGIVSPTGYSPAQPFTLDVFALAQETGANPANTDVVVLHGSTDAPVVDVTAVGVGTLINDIAYGSYTANYLSLPTADYNVQIRNSAGTDVVAEYAAPLQTLNLGGAALTVVASGFLNPANNSNGPAFGLWVALPSGGNLVQLPSVPVSTTRAQIIHNCADAAAATVDVWLNNTLLIDNFAFRTATPFVDAPAGTPFDITICGPNSTDTTQEVIRFSGLSLMNNTKYIIAANGIVSPTGYSPAQPFTLDIFALAQETGANPANTDLVVLHGSTDAPTVDVEEAFAGATLVNDIAYGDYTASYLSLPTADYAISITDATGNTVVASYAAPLQTLGLQGASLAVVASGFLNPANNSNGPAFGLWVALPAGGNMIPLPVVTSVVENTANAAITLFPNPAATEMNVNIDAATPIANVVVRVMDMTGRIVMNDDLGAIGTGNFRHTLNTTSLQQGGYIIEIVTDGAVNRQQIQIVR